MNKRRTLSNQFSPHCSRDFGYGDDERGWSCDMTVTDKDRELNTFLHYSDPTAREERSIFGSAKKGLFYNYSDRLGGDRWTQGWEKAKADGAAFKTARFYEIVLKHFHDSDDLNLQHIILGCNISTGYSYLVFGYTYTSKSGQ